MVNKTYVVRAKDALLRRYITEEQFKRLLASGYTINSRITVQVHEADNETIQSSTADEVP